ncbi:MAG: hypothetical protein ACR2FN_15185 [Chitinophagaceae bacterium]
MKGLNICSKILQQSSTKQVEHKHHLHKGIWISTALLVISILLSFGWFKSYNTEKLYGANDIKYRSLKLTKSKALLNLLYYTDTLYNLNSDSFKIIVQKKEKEILHQTDSIRIAGEKK